MASAQFPSNSRKGVRFIMLGPPIYITRAYRTSAAPNRERIAAYAGGNSLGPIVADTENWSLRAENGIVIDLAFRVFARHYGDIMHRVRGE
jgi:hypothetical protein